MRIVVTGGAGFIGSNLVHALVAAGHDVTVIDDLSTGHVANVHPAAALRTIDILDPALEAVFAGADPEAVVHLAAQASVSASFDDPERDRAVNATGTRRVAEAAASAGARRVLSASSAAVYGEPAEVPLVEGSPCSPTNPYGSSKLEAEGLLAEALSGSGVDYASLRFSNVYGPRQDHRGEGGVVAAFCGAIAEGRAPTIYGTGKQTRDFIYVGDVVSALIAAIESPATLSHGRGGDGAAYNISTGTETSVEALALHVRGASSFLAPFGYEDAREGDVERSALDPAKAAEVFGWRAAVPIEQGIGVTWRWFRGRVGEAEAGDDALCT